MNNQHVSSLLPKLGWLVGSALINKFEKYKINWVKWTWENKFSKLTTIVTDFLSFYSSHIKMLVFHFT